MSAPKNSPPVNATPEQYVVRACTICRVSRPGSMRADRTGTWHFVCHWCGDLLSGLVAKEPRR